jgi:hypothetical protein
MTLKMKKAELRAYIDARARELAASGKYHNWLSIETALRFGEGYEEAREILDRKWFRDYLDQLCRAAQRREKEQQAPDGSDEWPRSEIPE